MLAGGFVWSSTLCFRDYFLIWAEKPGLFTHFDAGPLSIGQYMATTPPQENIYVSPVPVDLASIQFASGQKEPAKSFNGRRCLVLLDQPVHAISYVIVHHEDERSLDALRAFYPQGRIVAQGPRHYNQPYFMVYRVPAHTSPQLTPQFAPQANWQGKLALLGFDLDGQSYAAGEQIELTFYWQALSKMDTPYTVFVHLLGETNPASGSPLWAGFDKQPGWDSYPTLYWTPGEIVVDRHTLSVPSETPPGTYELEIGLYYWATGERLRLESGLDHLVLKEVRIK
jgi:hypothetical protein